MKFKYFAIKAMLKGKHDFANEFFFHNENYVMACGLCKEFQLYFLFLFFI